MDNQLSFSDLDQNEVHCTASERHQPGQQPIQDSTHRLGLGDTDWAGDPEDLQILLNDLEEGRYHSVDPEDSLRLELDFELDQATTLKSLRPDDPVT